ncbi:MAG: PKD domain-containing protein, partial [Bacteroidetes bacterium]|nr:PKD domain-containing protein [Bacteroidota bacterium]
RVVDISGFNDTTIKVNTWFWNMYYKLLPNQEVTDTGEVQWTFDHGLAGPFGSFNGVDSILLIAGHNGCNDSVVKPVMIWIPVAQTGFSDILAVCSPPYTVTFSNASYGFTQFNGWEIRDLTRDTLIAAGGSDSTTQTFTRYGEYEYTVEVENDTAGPGGSGCTSIGGHVLRIDSAVADFTVTPASACLDGNVFNFTNTSFTAFGTIVFAEWDFGDGDILSYTLGIADSSILPIDNHNGRTSGTYKVPSHVYADTGSYAVRLVARADVSAFGSTVNCLYNITKNIQLLGVVADFTVDTTKGCIGLAVSFTDNSSSTSGINSYNWDFGDNSSSTQSDPSHTYTQPGTFDVVLHVVDNNGCTDSIEMTALIGISEPQAFFSISDTLACVGDSILFTNMSSGTGLQYNWIFGDGNISTAEDPVHQYATTDTFTVSLWVTDTNNCTHSFTRNNAIKIGIKPIAGFIIDIPPDICPPFPLEFMDSSSANVTTWLWDFGDNQTSQLKDPIHIYVISGSFDVSLLVSNDFGCTDIVSVAGLINIQGPIEQLNITPDSICSSDTVLFEANAINTAFYIWDLGDGTILDGITPAEGGDSLYHVYGNPGTYIPSLIMVSPTNCKRALPNIDTIYVDSVAAFFDIDPNLLCDLVELNIESSTFSHFPSDMLWDFGNGQTDTAANPVFVYDSGGIYTITFSVISRIDTSCRAQEQNNVNVFKKPLLTLTPSDTMGCVPLTFEFDASTTTKDVRIENWTWDFGDGFVAKDSNTLHTYQDPGTYTVILSAFYGNGNCKIDTIHIIETEDWPVADFSFQPNFPSLANSLVTFTDISIGASAWEWSFGTGDSSFEEHPIYKFEGAGEYEIVLKITNDVQCMDTVIQKIFISPEVFITLPNAFTPNNDGLNDKMRIIYAGLLDLTSFRIFNRWGEVVFETIDANEGWDGTFHGVRQDAGTYVYYVVAKTAEADEQVIKGNFTLIR